MSWRALRARRPAGPASVNLGSHANSHVVLALARRAIRPGNTGMQACSGHWPFGQLAANQRSWLGLIRPKAKLRLAIACLLAKLVACAGQADRSVGHNWPQAHVVGHSGLLGLLGHTSH